MNFIQSHILISSCWQLYSRFAKNGWCRYKNNMSTVKGAEEEFTILIAEDDPDDQYLFSSACHDIISKAKIFNVLTGRQLIQNLLETAVYGREKGVSLPSLIIADLKKPFFELEIIKEI